jgi:hypothetical protein
MFGVTGRRLADSLGTPPPPPPPLAAVLGSGIVRTGASLLTARRLISAVVVGLIRLVISARSPSTVRARTGVTSRGDSRSTRLKTSVSAALEPPAPGGAVRRGPEMVTPTSSRVGKIRSPGVARRPMWGLSKSRSETTFQPLPSIDDTRAVPLTSSANLEGETGSRTSVGGRALPPGRGLVYLPPPPPPPPPWPPSQPW